MIALRCIIAVCAFAGRCRAQLPDRECKRWTEEQELKQQIARGETIRLIATKHNRTVRAIESRL